MNDLLKNKMDDPSEATLLFVNKTLIIVLGAAGIGFSYLGRGFVNEIKINQIKKDQLWITFISAVFTRGHDRAGSITSQHSCRTELWSIYHGLCVAIR